MERQKARNSRRTLPAGGRVSIEWIPKEIRLQNYSDVWTKVPFLTYYLNIIKLSVIVTIGQILTCSMILRTLIFRFAQKYLLQRDELHIPVICYGLRTDFRREPFEGSIWLLAWADVIEELKTVCWCGQGANCNMRINEKGQAVKSGEQICLGANDKYVALCRKHYKEENLGPQA